MCEHLDRVDSESIKRKPVKAIRVLEYQLKEKEISGNNSNSPAGKQVLRAANWEGYSLMHSSCLKRAPEIQKPRQH